MGREPAIVKNAMVRSALGEVARSANDAAAFGGFDAADAHLSRTRLKLDAKGWEQPSRSSSSSNGR